MLLTENKLRQLVRESINKLLNESGSSGKIYDYLEEYTPYYIFQMYEDGEKLFPNLINASMYKQALSEFVKYGHFMRFPTRKIYSWMAIIMSNVAKIKTITEIAGHGQWSPIDEFIDFYFGNNDDPEDAWNTYKEEHGEDNDYGAMTDFLDDRGFYDWTKLPDGSDAWSDYGLQPLMEICNEYDDNMSPEEVIVLINRALDVVHCRGDLASAFINGGSKSLDFISNNTINEIVNSINNMLLTEETYHRPENYFRVKSMLNVPLKLDIENQTKHFQNDRIDRYNNLIEKLRYIDDPVYSFIVNTGHPHGDEIHTITQKGVVVIVNAKNKRIVTVFAASPSQIKRYWRGLRRRTPNDETFNLLLRFAENNCGRNLNKSEEKTPNKLSETNLRNIIKEAICRVLLEDVEINYDKDRSRYFHHSTTWKQIEKEINEQGYSIINALMGGNQTVQIKIDRNNRNKFYHFTTDDYNDYATDVQDGLIRLGVYLHNKRIKLKHELMHGPEIKGTHKCPKCGQMSTSEKECDHCGYTPSKYGEVGFCEKCQTFYRGNKCPDCGQQNLNINK
jgi:hypothetical protein